MSSWAVSSLLSCIGWWWQLLALHHWLGRESLAEAALLCLHCDSGSCCQAEPGTRSGYTTWELGSLPQMLLRRAKAYTVLLTDAREPLGAWGVHAQACGKGIKSDLLKGMQTQTRDAGADMTHKP